MDVIAVLVDRANTIAKDIRSYQLIARAFDDQRAMMAARPDLSANAELQAHIDKLTTEFIPLKLRIESLTDGFMRSVESALAYGWINMEQRDGLARILAMALGSTASRC